MSSPDYDVYGKTHWSGPSSSQRFIVYDFQSENFSKNASLAEKKTEATASRFWVYLAVIGLEILSSTGIGAVFGAKTGFAVLGLHGALAGVVAGAIAGLGLGIITVAYSEWKSSSSG